MPTSAEDRLWKQRNQERKVWFLIRGHSKGCGEIFWPSYNLVFTSLPGHVHMCTWCPWDTAVNKRGSILGKWAPVPFGSEVMVQILSSHKELGLFFPKSLTLYFLSSVSICYILPTHADFSWLMSAGILLLKNVLAPENWGGDTALAAYTSGSNSPRAKQDLATRIWTWRGLQAPSREWELYQVWATMVVKSSSVPNGLFPSWRPLLNFYAVLLIHPCKLS